MFTWICPKCGTEVQPSYSECPNCAKPPEERAAAAADATPAPAAAAPPAAAVRAVPTTKLPVPGWLVAMFVALLLVALGGGAYLYLLPSFKAKTETAAKPTLETPSAQSSSPAKPHPYAKFLEIAGLRISEDAKQKAQIRFVVVNHSAADLADMTLAVTLKPSTAKPEDKPLATISVKVPQLGPYEARDMEASVKTELRAYELPDWQFLRSEFEILSPAP